jgi:hypothetical protein
MATLAPAPKQNEHVGCCAPALLPRHQFRHLQDAGLRPGSRGINVRCLGWRTPVTAGAVRNDLSDTVPGAGIDAARADQLFSQHA